MACLKASHFVASPLPPPPHSRTAPSPSLSPSQLGVTPCLSLPPSLFLAAFSADSQSHLTQASLGPSNPCYLWGPRNQVPTAALLSSEAPLLPCSPPPTDKPLPLCQQECQAQTGSTVHLRETSQTCGHKMVEYSPFCPLFLSKHHPQNKENQKQKPKLHLQLN